MAMFNRIRDFTLCLIYAALINCAMGIQFSEAADLFATDADSAVPPLRIIDTIPQPDAGIIVSTRVYEDTSFAVLIETEYGINLTDPDSIRFLISDGEFDPYVLR